MEVIVFFIFFAENFTNMKHFYLCTMMLAAFVSATAQTKQLFDNGWKFTHEGKTVSVDLPHD